MSKFLLGVIQTNSVDDKWNNLERVGKLIDGVAERGAAMCVLPELFAYVGKPLEATRQQEPIPGPVSEFLSAKAREHGMWIHGGSYAETNPNAPDKPYNTSIVLNPQGNIVAKYRKIHLFDVTISNGPLAMESANRSAGEELVVFDSDFCRMGLSICYDMRFPELYRILALRGAKLIFVPALYMLYTGKDHWEPILRARAIENQCYIVAPDQVGLKANGQHAYGRSLVIDPWGNVIAKASDMECSFVTEIDTGLVDTVREQLPSLKNRAPVTYVW